MLGKGRRIKEQHERMRGVGKAGLLENQAAESLRESRTVNSQKELDQTISDVTVL